MNIIIREIEKKDYISVAAIWRNVLGFLPATDESVTRTYEKMKNDSRYCTFVAVLPEFQHCGIGKMLMDCVEKLAYRHNALAIGLASGSQRTGAHEFYEHLGYKKTSFYFRKNI